MTTPTGAVQLTEIVFPEQANHYGTLFGGNALQLMSKAAFLAARGAAQRDVVMAGVTDVRFLAPVPVGHVLTLRAWVSRVGRSSLTVCVTGLAETLDWSRALGELNAVSLDPATVQSTLGVLLKYQDDIARVQGSEAARLLAELREHARA